MEREYKDSSVAMVKYDFEADNNEVSLIVMMNWLIILGNIVLIA